MTGIRRIFGFADRRGIALVIVLWGLVLLAVIAAAFTTETRTEIRLAQNLVENAKARALADAGVYRAIVGLKETDPEHQWQTDGTVYAMASGEGEVSIVIADEAGKIDINRAPEELIRGLFTAIGLEESEAQALAAAVADFRDPDDLVHLGGAEAPEYRAAGLAHGPKNKPFEAIEELQQVLGLTREVYALAAPGFTVHSRSRGVDVSKAPAIVLLALPGVDPAAIEAFTQQRAERKAEGRSAAGGAGEGSGGGVRMTTLPGVGRQYAARSLGRVFTVRAEASTRSGAVFVREAVVSLGARGASLPFGIHAWRRGRRADATAGPGALGGQAGP